MLEGSAQLHLPISGTLQLWLCNLIEKYLQYTLGLGVRQKNQTSLMHAIIKIITSHKYINRNMYIHTHIELGQ